MIVFQTFTLLFCLKLRFELQDSFFISYLKCVVNEDADSFLFSVSCCQDASLPETGDSLELITGPGVSRPDPPPPGQLRSNRESRRNSRVRKLPPERRVRSRNFKNAIRVLRK